jgi:hypothetical protein
MPYVPNGMKGHKKGSENETTVMIIIFESHNTFVYDNVSRGNFLKCVKTFCSF